MTTTTYQTQAIDTRGDLRVPVRAVVTEKAAKMPNSCRAPYVRVAAMLMLDGASDPAMISERSAGCVRILRCSAPVPRRGSTPRSGRVAAEREAEEAELSAPKTVAWRALTGRQQRLAAALALTAALRTLAA
jgi:hypothetical protein